jgi:hypothetical protein
MSGFPSATFRLLTQTPAAGFALQNGTPTILSWTAPHDGQLHFVHCISRIWVTAAETGGDVNINTTLGGQSTDDIMFGGNLGVGFAGPSINTTPWYYPAARPMDPGSTIALVQAQALTAGAATVFAAFFGA